MLGLYVSNSCNKDEILRQIMANRYLLPYIDLSTMTGALFSSLRIEELIDEELRHDAFLVKTDANPALHTMSSGQQRKALLAYIVAQRPQYVVLDDVYSSIDKATQQHITRQLMELSATTVFIQLFYRKTDVLPCIDTVLIIDHHNIIVSQQSREQFFKQIAPVKQIDVARVITPKHEATVVSSPLIRFTNVSTGYGDKPVLKNISWTIEQGEFWQLIGSNGSGKSTLLSLITGDNARAYGQDIELFGRRKGTGETIWDIKKHIGYFTPAMTMQFTHGDTVENMIISGLVDSVGLYIIPTDLQKRLASAWVDVLGSEFRNKQFNSLSLGQQRMVLVVRAMIKQPPLLILDEPTAGLDDENTALFLSLIKAVASHNTMAIVYVSHRDEPGLCPQKSFELIPHPTGATGSIT